MGFLPDNYEAPATGGKFTKIKEGETRIRILGEAVVGWSSRDDTTNKPVTTQEKHSKIGMNEPNYFLAFPVWNYKEERLQVYQLTTKSIQKAIVDLNNSEDWGDPTQYDLIIKRTGTDIANTKYSVMPAPKKILDKDIEEEYKKSGIDLRELFRGGNPFEPTANSDGDLPF